MAKVTQQPTRLGRAARIPPKEAAPRRRRLAPEDREREIIEGAVAFFAEVGFEGGLRRADAKNQRLPKSSRRMRTLSTSGEEFPLQVERCCIFHLLTQPCLQL
jgi:hypothetical protein